ncbi:MAG: hypothetical protein D5R99_00730 [Methanocalculus sp. MSAO_Arc1]|uniref:hypothetical protein n=1 Tax=Methanocalculus TaxID=71151 RepID=UPI000FF34312|nr:MULTISPECIES: hypothetical protein [unclassified Methanocalculus]MCP1661661.1 hypothetical protein [Methanocalculus sp. AMF5]RQD81923.1 MAG: hypothetical protein D5R99_00730 [Methanocalculus sp. MSAO_Arc1]
MDSLAVQGLRLATILGALCIAVVIGLFFQLPLLAILLVAVAAYIIGDLALRLPAASSPRRRRV